MAGFRPSVPFSTPLMLLVPTSAVVSGVNKKVFPKIEDGILIFGSWKSYGGTENMNNGVYSIVDTAIIECFYRPEIKSDCRIGVPATGGVYEVIGEPENIEMRNQYLRFKVRRVTGGV